MELIIDILIVTGAIFWIGLPIAVIIAVVAYRNAVDAPDELIYMETCPECESRLETPEITLGRMLDGQREAAETMNCDSMITYTDLERIDEIMGL